MTRGDTVALMVSNRPEFMVADLAATMLGATPFSIYLTSAPDQIAYVIKDAGARVAIVEAPFKAAVRAAGRVRDHRRGDGRARGTGLRARLARRRARRHPHDHLHVGHDRPAEGRPAHARQRDGGRGRGGAARRLPGRLARDLVAAERARRRAHRPPLPADRLRHDDHDLPGPAPDRRVPAGGQADVVLRRPARVGEAQGRGGGQAGRQRAGAAGCSRRPSRRRAAQAGQAGARRPGGRVEPGEAQLFAPLRAGDRARRGEARQRRRGADAARGARVLPRHRRPAGRDLGHERDLRRGRVQPGGADQDRHRRAAVAGRGAQAGRGRRAARRARRS